MKANYENKNIITAGRTNNFTIVTSGNNDIPVDKVIAQVGNKLSLSNGKIVVGENVNHVLVSGKVNMWLVQGNGNAKNFVIKHNETNCITSMNTIERTSGMNCSKGLNCKLVNVQEGDSFSLSVYGGVNDAISENEDRTYITIEVVD